MTIIAFNRYWVIRWHWVLVSFFAVLLLMSLSFWQLTRATEKKQTLDTISQSKSLDAYDSWHLLSLDEKSLDAMPVQFPARWVAPMIWLLDNRMIDGRVGYDVVVAVEQITASRQVERSSAPAFLVNLGWIAATGGRDQLPAVIVPEKLTIDGIFRTEPTGLLLGENIEDKGEWPMRIQQLDTETLSVYIPSLVKSGVIFQQRESPFRIHYQPVILPPERHTAYAVQWALLAIAVIVVALSASAAGRLVNDEP